MLRRVIKAITGLSVVALAIAISCLDSDGYIAYIVAIPCVLWLFLMAVANGFFYEGEEVL